MSGILGLGRRCVNGNQLADVLGWIDKQGSEYDLTLSRVLAKPRPRSQEWLATLAALSTDVPPEAPFLPAEVELDFPGRRDSRTVVQVLASIPADGVAVGDFAGFRSVDFQVIGEVVRGDRLFESFRYKFGHPADDLGGRIPLAFHRYLRPGPYTLILRIEDLNGRAFHRTEQEILVPARDDELLDPTSTDPETDSIYAEATAAMASGDTSIRIMPPRDGLVIGQLRVDTLAVGAIERVTFFLDDQPVMTKTRPPYNVELDLGDVPRLHTLRVEAFGPGDELEAVDERLLNAGGNRFSVRIIEPSTRRRYERSLEARLEVEVPEGRTVERVELYLDERPVATLYQEPWVQPIALPAGGAIAYLRAVAYLPDGNSTEDLVFVNAPENLEELDINTVELYATVLDPRGRPIEELGPEAFRILEDGAEQELVRFERVRSLPIHVGVVLDNSASMRGQLPEVRRAALTFLRQAITPRDRAAIITFNAFPHLAVGLTNDIQTLGGGLAGLTAEGETALYDSLIFSLYYLAGIRGERALLLLSDGRDESSRFSFDETLEYARRAGVTVYPIGLRLPGGSPRSRLEQLADETGGRTFFIDDVAELASIYDAIQEELRSRYLLVYQSTNTSDDRAFRVVDLEVDHPNAEAKTIRGYYP